jgi:L-seryl-tRNA(Ser) seleniumtransferase
VEIGGSFRIPDVMRKSGARLVEVGTTNRTHLRDYEQAITGDTALLLKVHASNFRILGFTAEVSLKEMAALGKERGLPVMEDLGSGCFVDLSPYGIEHEPTVQETIQAGADVVTFSGDKLLGGPQAGILLGKRKFIDLIKRNPLNRALRVDKLTLAGLESTLRVYLDPERVMKILPALSMLTCPPEELERRARRFQRKLSRDFSSVCSVRLKEENSQVGGGALPLQELPTRVVALRPLKLSATSLEERMRKNTPPVIVRMKEEEILLDMRTVAKEEEAILLEAVKRALGKSELGMRNAE